MIVVYTAHFGAYDTLKPVESIPGVRFVCFTDGADVDGWGCLRPTITEPTPARENRKYKSCPHLLFPHSDWTIYQDANLQLTTSPVDIVSECRDGLNVFRHNVRQCAYAEASAVRGRVDRATLDNQLQRYRAAGYPVNAGLYWGGLIIRTRAANEFNERWWQEIQSGVCRDQISLPFSMWQTGVEYHVLSGGIPFYGGVNRFCVRYPHA